jgi:hypothetical protein
MTWPFQTKYPTFTPGEVDGRVYDYIVVGGVFLSSLFVDGLTSVYYQVARLDASSPLVLQKLPEFPFSWSSAVPSLVPGPPESLFFPREHPGLVYPFSIGYLPLPMETG